MITLTPTVGAARTLGPFARVPWSEVHATDLDSELDVAPSGHGTAVLVPVKSFDLAKGRLSDRLGPGDRDRLARRLASGVIAAARPLPTYVVCDSDLVADWAVEIGIGVLEVTATGLNPAMTEAVVMAASMGHNRAIISHADLPLAEDLTWLDEDPLDHGVVVVTDRHGTGTNVLTLPLDLDPPFVFQYGPGSAGLHRAEAQRLGLPVRVIHDERLGWDLDTPEDLTAWLAVGAGTTDREPKGAR